MVIMCATLNIGWTVNANQPLPKVSPVADEILRQLHLGEPDITPHVAFLLMVNQKGGNEMLVIAATPAATKQCARAKKGALWNASSKNAMSAEAFQAPVECHFLWEGSTWNASFKV